MLALRPALATTAAGGDTFTDFDTLQPFVYRTDSKYDVFTGGDAFGLAQLEQLR